MNAKKTSFLDAIGHRLEKLIDSIPILGVPTPIQPWNPLEDTKAAILSDPFDVVKTLLKWDGFSFGRLLGENSLYLSNMRMTKKGREENPLVDREEHILVTSDDASVERSVASFADLNTDDDSYEQCPSVVTECDVENAAEREMKGIEVHATVEPREVSDDDMMTDDEHDYVLAEEPESEEEDFIDLGADTT